MRNVTASVAVLAAGALVGWLPACAPEPELLPDVIPDDSLSARELFDAAVYPSLDVRCGVCHGKGSAAGELGFVDPDPALAYDTLTHSVIVGDFHPDTAPLATIGAHEGAMLSPGETARLLDWLTREVEERGGAKPAPGAPL